MIRTLPALSLALSLAIGCTAYVPGDDSSDSTSSAVIHGTEELGYQAVVRLHGIDDAPENTITCTGTLIAPELVLTAAHCLSKTVGWVGFGLHGAEMPVPAAQQLTHPNWSGNVDEGFDVGIVLLAGQLKAVAPMAFSANEADGAVGQQIRLVGFGNDVPDSDTPADDFGTGFGTKRSATLAAAQVDPSGQADRVFLKVQGADGTQACLGDSGSPVFFTGADGVERIVAITSSARIGCQGTGSLHVRTWLVADWIQAVVDYVASQDAQPSAPAPSEPAPSEPAPAEPAPEA